MSWLAKNRGMAAVWALAGGGVLVGSAWYLNHVSPHLSAAGKRDKTDPDKTDVDAFLEIVPWLGLVLGTYFLYMGVIRLAFGRVADVVDADRNSAGKVLYWIGFLGALGAVALVAVFVLHLPLWAINRDHYK